MAPSDLNYGYSARIAEILGDFEYDSLPEDGVIREEKDW